MNDVHSVLERESLRHELPAGSFDRLIRKRDRRRRNQRITAGVVAFAVVAAAFAGALDLLHQSRVSPAAQTITPQNVGKLKLLWSAPLDATVNHSQFVIIDRSFPHFSPVVSGGLVLTSDKEGILYAFPTSCSSTCQPAWTTDSGVVSYAPTVVDGIAYIASESGQVSAYRLDCATDGSMCKPIWTGQAGRGINSSPVVSGGMLFGIDAERSTVYAFSTSCTGTCAPSWTAYVGPALKTVSLTPSRCDAYKGAIVAPAVSNGVVLAPDPVDFTLHGLDVASGRQLWVARPQVVMFESLITGCPRVSRSGWVDAPVVDGNTVYWAGGPSVYGYPVSCRRDGGTCRSTWRSTNGAFGQPVVAGGIVFVPDASRQRIDAFAASCRRARGPCPELWHMQLPGGRPEGGIVGAQLMAGPERLVVTYSVGPQRIAFRRARLAAFPIACDSRVQPCRPEWRALSFQDYDPAPAAVVDGLAYLGTTGGLVAAYPETCPCNVPSVALGSVSGGVNPTWTFLEPVKADIRPVNKKVSTPTVSGGKVFVTRGDGQLLAFGLPPQAVPPEAAASAQRGAAIFYLAVALAGAAFLAAAVVRKRRRGSASAA